MSDTSPETIEIVQQVRPAALLETPLAASLASSSLPLIEYRGTQTVEAFSSTSEELAALLDHCGVFDLGWRRFLRCSGRDRVRWLNGMVTNSVKGLEQNTGCYAFVLNAQGRIQGDLNIYWLRGQEQESLWIETDCSQVETLTAFLRRYIIMDQVVLEPCDAWTAIGIAGPDAAEKLAALGLSAEGLLPIHAAQSAWHNHAIVISVAPGPCVPRFEIWIESNAVGELWAALTDVGATPCGVNAVEQLRILEGTPAYGVDITDHDLPQETNQMRALSFTKGCYLGQEIVERIRSRGNVHRTFNGFRFEGNPVQPRTPIMSDGKQVGEITSAVRVNVSSAGEQILALGYIRREALETKQTLTADGNAVQPCALPFDFAVPSVQL